MAQIYFLLPTALGEAKLANAQALGVPLKLTAMAVGDGNGVLPVPNRERTTLVNERRRAAINSIIQDPANLSQIIAEQVIPENVGGWWIREAGLFDEDGVMIYYANIPETYKPVLAEGSARTQVVRLVCLVTGGATVELKVDPSIVLATRSYVDTQIAAELDKRDAKQSALVATTGPLAALSGLQTIDTVVLTAGARVLVKDQASAKDNGIYLAAAGAWTRATDADSGLDVTAGMLVPVEQGAINGDSVWQLTTDGPIIVGTTPLAFKRVGAGYFATLESPDFTGIAKVDTAALGTETRQAASTAFTYAVARKLIADLVASSPAALDTLNELAAALGNDANFSATVFAQIAQRALLNGSNAQAFSVAAASQPEHAARLSQIGHGQCRLSVVNAGTLKLSPYGGNNLIINGVPQQVPSAGVTVTNAGLANYTVYYVYAYMNAGAMALELSTTGHSTAPNGVETVVGNTAKTLVGMVCTIPGGNTFADTYGMRLCLNWFNRRALACGANTAPAVNFTSTAKAEISTLHRCYLLNWADEAVYGGCDGEMASSGNNSSITLASTMDGGYWGADCGVYQISGANGLAYASHGCAVPNEGVHVASIYGSMSVGSTGTLITGFNSFLTRG